MPCSEQHAMDMLQGCTALHLAVSGLWSTVVAVLADSGANLNAKNRQVNLHSVWICMTMLSAF